MTKKVVLVTLALAALVLVPVAAAHGAPEARSIDTRAVADNTGFGDYGSFEGVPIPIVAPALDLLALDVREAYGPDGSPGLWFRVITQTDTPEGDHRIDITFTLGGIEHAFDLSTADHVSWTSSSFGAWTSSIPVGDGHPQAVDAFASYASLGAAAGDTLTALEAISSESGESGDVMPGGYSTMVGPAVLPMDDSSTQDYTLAGPAPLLAAGADASSVDLNAGDEEVAITFTVTSGAADIEQQVAVSIVGPDGTAAAADMTDLILAPGQSRDVVVTLDPHGASAGDLRITAASDLGGRAAVTIPLVGATATDDRAISTADIAAGESFQQVFTTLGTFSYHCHPHPWMTGSLTVEGAPNGTDPAVHTIEFVEEDPSDPQTWRFIPDELTIHSGDTVVWLNSGSAIHTVMGGFGSGAMGGHGHDHSDHDHEHADTMDHGEEETTPGIGMLLLTASVAAAAVARRR